MSLEFVLFFWMAPTCFSGNALTLAVVGNKIAGKPSVWILFRRGHQCHQEGFVFTCIVVVVVVVDANS